MSSATGAFDVKLTPQKDDRFEAGRMLIKKAYTGGLNGSGIGQMISKRTENGPSIYYAIEEFSGTVDDKSGAFTLIHKGHMTQDSQSLDVTILEGSGTGELRSISGSMLITREGEGHSYELTFELE